MAADFTVRCEARIEGRWRLKFAGVLLRVLPMTVRRRAAMPVARWATDRAYVTVAANGRQVSREPIGKYARLVLR